MDKNNTNTKVYSQVHDYKIKVDSLETFNNIPCIVGQVDLGLKIYLGKILPLPSLYNIPLDWLQEKLSEGTNQFVIKTRAINSIPFRHRLNIPSNLINVLKIVVSNIRVSSEDESMQYIYKGNVVDIYDADTITYDFDLGFCAKIFDQKMRLNRINAPEMRGDERDKGIISRDYLRGALDEQEVLIKTIKGDKKGKFGRWLAEVLIPGESGFINVNDKLVELGYAEYKAY
jgi:micrococcal nuclease